MVFYMVLEALDKGSYLAYLFVVVMEASNRMADRVVDGDGIPLEM